MQAHIIKTHKLRLERTETLTLGPAVISAKVAVFRGMVDTFDPVIRLLLSKTRRDPGLSG